MYATFPSLTLRTGVHNLRMGGFCLGDEREPACASLFYILHVLFFLGGGGVVLSKYMAQGLDWKLVPHRWTPTTTNGTLLYTGAWN